MSERLAQAECKPCAAGQPPLAEAESDRLLAMIDGWMRTGNAIAKTYRFGNYYETLAFVNATAWISHRQDHHPDLAVGYNQCQVVFTTHAVGGLSKNDFICAAKMDALFAL